MKEVRGSTELYSAELIQERVAAMAADINACYAGKDVVFICVLKGAFMFFADLLKHVTVKPEVDFVRVASYGKSDASMGTITFSKDVELSVRDKHIVLVEDVVDSGLTIDFLVRQFEARGVKSLRIAALIDKVERREADVNVDFAGFTLSSGFIVGYGMDYAESFRELPAIHCLDFGE